MNEKEEVYYTVGQALKLLSISKPTVYDWATKGIITEVENSEPKLFIIPTDLIERRSKLSKAVNKKDQLNEVNLQEENVNNKVNNPVSSDNELIIRLLNKLDDKDQQIVEYAEAKGQVKLLTDDLLFSKETYKELKAESDLYKEEVFKLRYENKALIDQVNQLSKQVKELQEKSVRSVKNLNSKEVKPEESKPVKALINTESKTTPVKSVSDNKGLFSWFKK